MPISVGMNLPRFDGDEYDAAKMRRLVEELERVGALLEADTSGQTVLVGTVTTTPYIAGEERVILVDDDVIGGPATVVLGGAAPLQGRLYYIKKLGSTGIVTVDPDGSELIDDSLTKLLTTQYDSMTIVSDGTAWWIL